MSLNELEVEIFGVCDDKKPSFCFKNIFQTFGRTVEISTKQNWKIKIVSPIIIFGFFICEQELVED